jgi:hypothetical protein
MAVANGGTAVMVALDTHRPRWLWFRVVDDDGAFVQPWSASATAANQNSNRTLIHRNAITDHPLMMRP